MRYTSQVMPAAHRNAAALLRSTLYCAQMLQPGEVLAQAVFMPLQECLRHLHASTVQVPTNKSEERELSLAQWDILRAPFSFALGVVAQQSVSFD